MVLTESEYDLQRDLCTVRKRLTNFLSLKTWLGITGTVITDFFFLPPLVQYLCYKVGFCHYACSHVEFISSLGSVVLCMEFITSNVI